MKYCPSCQITYTDDGLQFCLEDGNRLLSYSGQSSQMPTVAFSETETVVRQNLTLPGWEQSRVTQKTTHQPEVKKSNALLIVMVTALMMCVLLGGAVGMWMVLSSDNSKVKVSSDKNTGFYNASNAFRSPSPSPKSTVKKDTVWEPMNYQASINGTNLTYYRGTTVEQCQADCAKNPKCKAFTLIRAGAYNPNDPPMCYLAAEVTEVVTHPCCISAIKSESDDASSNRVNNAETQKACDYFLSASLYKKWEQTGGKDGKLGCPTMNEIETEKSPQGTTGRMTRFNKGDGGFIIRHDTGVFAGTAFEVSGCMFKLYADIGGTGSWLGFPIQDGYSTSTGARQNFEDGYILWDSKTYNCQAFRN